MKRFINEESGVLTFEWILLISVLVIGIVGGLSAVRDALICELADVASAMVALDQSYYICWPWEVGTPDDVVDGACASYYRDVARINQARVNEDGPGWSSVEDDGLKPQQNVTAINSANKGTFISDL